MKASRALVALVGVAGLIAVPSSLPALAQAGSASEITHRQSVLTEISPSGEPTTARVFTQLTVVGEGQVAVALPGQATRGLRNLVGFGRPRVDGETVHFDVAASRDGTLVRTVADHVADDPVEFEISYHLDGQPVEPREVVGESGRLTVTYTIRNTTAQPVELQFADGKRRSRSETVDVSVPMVGSLSVTLDDRFTGVEAPGAAVAGDGRGNTVVNFSLLLFSPIGSDEQSISYSADVVDAIVPEARAQVLPVSSESFGSLQSSEDAYQGAVLSTRELTRGAMQLDQGVQQLGRGSSSLLDGLVQLRDGMQELSEGLKDRAAPGAQQVSEGLGSARAGGNTLANGLGDLRDGADRLTAGLSDARNGGIRLSDGLGQLAGGTQDLRAGARQLAGGATQLDAGASDLASGTVQVRDGLDGLRDGLLQLRGGIGPLLNGIGTAATPDTLLNGLGRIGGGLSNASCNLADPQNQANPCGLLQVAGLLRAGIGDVTLPELAAQPDTLLGGLRDIQLGLSNPSCVITNPQDPANPCGIRQVARGSGDPLAGGIHGGAAQLATELTTAHDALSAIVGNDLVDDVIPLPALGGGTARDVIEQIIADIGASDDPQAAADTARRGLARMRLAADGIADGVDAIVAGLGTATTEDTIRHGLAQIHGALGNVQAGIGASETPETLLNGVARLTAGLDNPAAFNPNNAGYNPTCQSPAPPAQPCGLRQGLQLLQAGLGTTSDEPTESLLGAADALTDGSKDLAAGAERLRDEGTAPLAAGANTLSSGATRLADGAGTASSGSRDLVDGLRQLTDGGMELSSGAARAATGAGDLRDGLVQLDDGMQELADGIVTAADGSDQVADGLISAANGGGLVDGGVSELREEGILVLADAVSDASGDAELLLETVKAVDERGRNGEGLPYGTVEGARASAVFQYDIAGVGTDPGPSTAAQLLLAVVALGAAGAVTVGVRRITR